MPKKKKEDTSNHPWVSNYPPLKEWLDKLDARCVWQLPMQCEHSSAREEMGYPTSYVEMYMARGADGFPRLFVVVVHANRHGWEIYTPHSSPRIDETLADAEQRIGLVKS